LLDREAIRQFYHTNFGMIFELLRGAGPPPELWAGDHRANIVHQYVTHLHGHGPILDYGGGIGQQALFLARAGYQVAYADLGETANFAAWRFEREGLLQAGFDPPGHIHVCVSPETAIRDWLADWKKMLADIEALKVPILAADDLPARWGALCALDVVEHVPDPVGLLQQFVDALAPDGVLILTHDSFKPFPTHLPESAELQQGLDAVLAGMGWDAVIPPDGHFGIGAWKRARGPTPAP
jgi:SAM-dependent methyltransferase